jgi:chaperone modulatory protein CbpM
MTPQTIHGIEILDEDVIGLIELMSCAHIERARVVEMVEAGLLDPIGGGVDEWRFAARDLRRLRMAERLCADLDVNVSGAALILDLIEERDTLLTQVETLRRLMADM